MDPGEKNSKDVALQQPHILGMCAKHIYTKEAYMMTNRLNYNIINNLTICEKDIKGRKHFIDLSYGNLEDEYEISLKADWFNLVELDVEIDFFGNSASKSSKRIKLIGSILDNYSSKATNLISIEFKIENWPKSKPYSRLFMNKMSKFGSVKVQKITIKLDDFYLFSKFLLNGKDWEMMLKEKFLNTKSIDLSFQVPTYNGNDDAFYDAFCDWVDKQKSLNIEAFTIHVSSMTYNFIKTFARLSNKIKLTYDPKYNEGQDMLFDKFKVDLYKLCTYNLLLFRHLKGCESREIFTKIVQLHLTEIVFTEDEDELERGIVNCKLLKNVKIFQVSIEYSGEYSDKVNRIIKKYLYAMPDKLQVLQICGSKFSFEGLGKQFSNAYPNLKRFSYYVGDGEECMFDADFFVGFKELQVIETECHKNAKIILPDSLKVLNLSCSTEEVDSSEGHINHDKYKGEEIKESEKRECCNYLNCQTILKNVLQRDKGCTYFKQLIDLVRYRKSQEY